MAAVSLYNNSVEPQCGSPYLNVDSTGNVAVYSSFGDNASILESNWFDSYTSSTSLYTLVETFFPLPDEASHLAYPTEEAGIRFNCDASEILHYGQDRPAIHANLVDILKNMIPPEFAEAGRCFEQELFATAAKMSLIDDDGSCTNQEAGTVTFNSIDEVVKHESPPLNMKVKHSNLSSLLGSISVYKLWLVTAAKDIFTRLTL